MRVPSLQTKKNLKNTSLAAEKQKAADLASVR